MDVAKRIYSYLSDKYSCTSSTGLYLTSNLKNVQKTKSGNVADINLMLVAMLNHEGINTHPVILSTRSHGYAHEFYPLLDRYNYVVAQAEIDGKKYHLDATEPGLPFGTLSLECYNGQARVMHEMGNPLYLQPDSITEKKTTTLFLSNTENGWQGEMVRTMGIFESLETGQEIKSNGTAGIKSRITKGVPQEFKVEDPVLENLELADNPLKVKYAFKPELDNGEEVVYLNPFLGEEYKNNPFGSAERYYPVEMPYAMNDLFIANIEVRKDTKWTKFPKARKWACLKTMAFLNTSFLPMPAESCFAPGW
jgi:hypothetical protein